MRATTCLKSTQTKIERWGGGGGGRSCLPSAGGMHVRRWDWAGAKLRVRRVGASRVDTGGHSSSHGWCRTEKWTCQHMERKQVSERHSVTRDSDLGLSSSPSLSCRISSGSGDGRGEYKREDCDVSGHTIELLSAILSIMG